MRQLVKQMMEEQATLSLPHKCFYCKYFTFKVVDGVEQEGVGNRGCRYPGDIEVEGEWTDGICLMWEAQPDPRKRKRSFISYFPKET